MACLAEVFRTLNDMTSEEVVTDYAIGGAMAALFYTEVTRTYHVDVLALIPSQTDPIIRMTEFYAWARKHAFNPDRAHILIHSVPVWFLSSNDGVEFEAVQQARTFDYQGVPVRVIRPEHLVVLYVLAGGVGRRERTSLLLEAGAVDRQKLREVLERHQLTAQWREKWGHDV
jgi:hypothetical protein